MRIALVVTEFPSASQTFVLDHACALIRCGHDVQLHALKVGNLSEVHADIEQFKLCSRSRCAPPKNTQSSPALSFFQLFLKGWRDLLLHPILTAKFLRTRSGYRVERLRRCLTLWAQGPDYDLIHAHSGYNGERLLPLYEAGHLHAPLIVTFHGHDVFGYLKDRPLTHYQALFARASTLIVCSDFMRMRLLELGAPHQKLRVIPNPVQADQILFRAVTAVTKRPLQLLTVGRLVPVKGLENLVEALAEPCLRALDLQVHIVGDGPLRDALTSSASEKGVADRVVFHGACTREQVMSLMRCSDLYVAPGITDIHGHAETQGIAILEAMASGLPVIASAVGGIPETLGDCAVSLVPSGDPAALAFAIAAWAAHPDRYQAISHNGRLRVEAVYSPARWINALEAAYDQAMEIQSI